MELEMSATKTPNLDKSFSDPPGLSKYTAFAFRNIFPLSSHPSEYTCALTVKGLDCNLMKLLVFSSTDRALPMNPLEQSVGLLWSEYALWDCIQIHYDLNTAEDLSGEMTASKEALCSRQSREVERGRIKVKEEREGSQAWHFCLFWAL